MAKPRHIVCLSSIDWDFVWQGHQEVMSRLAEAGNVVLFVENTGVRGPRLKDIPRLRHRLRNWRRGVQGFREERPNLFVYSPLVLPFPYSRVAGALNRRLLVNAIRRWMRATGFGRPMVWTFLPTPTALNLIDALDPELTIYYCIDDFPSSSPAARRIVRSELRLFAEADLVFVTSERLRERAARTSRNVHLFPFGVKFEAFDAVRASDPAPPDDVRDLPRPLIGYVGGVHQWIDQDIVAGIARAMPGATVALVGPIQTDVSRLQVLPNVRLLGGRAHTEIPRYVAAFDVTLVPYRKTEYTANVYPTKLNEYLAMGKPVIATDLAEIRRFNAEHGDIVAVAQDAEGFVTAIGHALRKDDPSETERRIDVARSNSWTTKIGRMAMLIDGKLAARTAAGARWQDVLRRSYRLARRRAGLAALALLSVYGLVFETPFIWWVASPLRVEELPRRADAIVVFAGGVGESGKAGGGYQERVARAVELYRAGYAPRLVFSSGFRYAFAEADVMRGLATDLGVPPEAIVLETRAANTYENVVNSAAILDRETRRSALLVTSPYHTRRALLTWRRQAPHIAVTSVPVAGSQFYARGRGASLEQIQGIVHEYEAIAGYWWRGWIR